MAGDGKRSGGVAGAAALTTPEANGAVHTVGTFEWAWFGPGELLPLQEQLELRPLLRLRATSKAVRDQLDAVAPPKVQLARWILDQKIVETDATHRPDNDSNPAWKAYIDAHKKLSDAPCVRRASTRLLVDVYALLMQMYDTLVDEDLATAARCPSNHQAADCRTFR